MALKWSASAMYLAMLMWLVVFGRIWWQLPVITGCMSTTNLTH